MMLDIDGGNVLFKIAAKQYLRLLMKLDFDDRRTDRQTDRWTTLTLELLRD